MALVGSLTMCIMQFPSFYLISVTELGAHYSKSQCGPRCTLGTSTISRAGREPQSTRKHIHCEAVFRYHVMPCETGGRKRCSAVPAFF